LLFTTSFIEQNPLPKPPPDLRKEQDRLTERKRFLPKKSNFAGYSRVNAGISCRMKPNLEEEISNENYSIHVRGVDFGCQHGSYVCRRWWIAIESSEKDLTESSPLENGVRFP
jgi:hypothetical protein